jgi:phospholipid transport system transporter-binding protein
MGKVEFTDLGDGHFALSGDASFQTAETILRASEKVFAGHSNLEVNLAAVEETDSAGLALLLEWISRAANTGSEIRFADIPEKIKAIAVTAEINELLERAYSSSSK